MGFCPYCGNWVDEGDICSHCGSSGDYEEEEEDLFESEKTISPLEYFTRQAKTSSIKGNHEAAIGFYTEALRNSVSNGEKSEMLAALAREYETIYDYDSAEAYWNKCCSLERWGRALSVYRHLAEKGNFLYRRWRYKEAIGTYEESLKELEGLSEKYFDLEMLKYYARIAYFITDSYILLGENIPKDYHNVLSRGIEKYLTSKERSGDEANAYYLSETAWELYSDDGLYDEALIFIDTAIKLHPNPPANDYNRKAIMLEAKQQYEEALKYYDVALSMDEANETFLKNRTACEAGCIREKLKRKILLNETEPQDLDLIDEAMEMLPESYDKSTYLNTKGDILNDLGDPVNARICHFLSGGYHIAADEAKRQLERLNPNESYIYITGIHYYQDSSPFRQGTIVDLIKEPGNPHDRDAIRVDIKGETVGYVANNKYNLIKEVKSATDLKKSNAIHAEVQFLIFGDWVIAKLI